MFDSILNQFASFFDAYLFITAPLFLVVGLAMAFYGLVISQIIAWLIGFFWGAIAGVAVGYLMDGELGALVGFIVLGSIMGSIFLWIAISIPKIIGFFAAYLSMVLLVQPEGWGHILPLALGLIGGWFGGFLNRSFIIITSSLIGAWMVTTSSLRLYGHFDSGFYGNVFDAVGHYALVGVLLYSFVTISGIFKQYGIFSIYSGFDSFFENMSSKDTKLGSQDNQFGEFIKYCLDKSELVNVSKGFSWMHALVSWLFALTFLGVAPALFYAASAFSEFMSGSLILGWIQLKGLLSVFMAAYFGIAFYQAIKSLNNSKIPKWSVRFTFRWGIVLSMLWIIASLVPLMHGRVDIDGILILFALIPMILQYRHEKCQSLVAQTEAT